MIALGEFHYVQREIHYIDEFSIYMICSPGTLVAEGCIREHYKFGGIDHRELDVRMFLGEKLDLAHLDSHQIYRFYVKPSKGDHCSTTFLEVVEQWNSIC